MAITLRQQLLEVRSAILSIPQIRKEKEKIINERDSSYFKLTSPDSYQFEKSNTASNLEKDFMLPILQPYREEAEKKGEEARRITESSILHSGKLKIAAKLLYRILFSIILITLSFSIIVGGGFLTYLIANWSWDTSIYEFMHCTYLGDSGFLYEHAVGIHMLSLTLALVAFGIPSFIIGKRTDKRIAKIPLLSASVLLTFAAIISLIISLNIYHSTEQGFFLKILLFFSYLLFIPKAFFMWVYTLPFLIVPIVTLTATVFAVFGCVKYISSIYNSRYDELRKLDKAIKEAGYTEYERVFKYEYSKAPKIDLTELYSSQKYKDAVKFDKAKDIETLDKYREYYSTQLKKHNELVLQYNIAIDQYDKLIQKCEDIIAYTTFLHSHEKNVDTINIIIYYIDYRHATSIREALQDWEDDKHRMIVEQTMSDFTREHNKQITQLIKELDNIQTDISLEFENINCSLNAG